MIFKTARLQPGLAFFLLAAMSGYGQARTPGANTSGATLLSPDRMVQVSLRADPFSYHVSFHGHTVVDWSALGLEMKAAAPWTPLRIKTLTRREADQTWNPVWGKASDVRNHFTELSALFVESGGTHRKLGITVRCYDGGVAFRYEVPAGGNRADFVLERERTTFRFPVGTTSWASVYKGFHEAYESEYPQRNLKEIQPGELIGLPALLQTSPKTWALLTEADLTDWAGMYLRRTGDALDAVLSPRKDGDGLVRSQAPRHSPWRVLMLAASPLQLVESNLIENLSAPPVPGDTAWIKPGMMAWDHWWSGDVDMTTETNKRFIDFAATMGFPYQLVDWQWYGPFNKPSADITRPAPKLDMQELLAYAHSRHVRLWLWIHSGDVDRAISAGAIENAFSTYESWGIAGVKIDFMNSDDQDRVRWYESTVQLAAKHHLMVDFHGAYKPTGLQVTFPNLLTREGVLGNEYNKFSRRVTPLHKTTLPFTRGLAGPMDYTPGGFLNRSPEDFAATVPTQVMGSRASELALFVVYWSPLTCVTDDPEHYIHDGKEEPGLSFLRGLPTVWDETRALDGAVGDHIVIARRSGDDWWLGGIAADRPYSTTLSLAFLRNGRYRAHIYSDPLSDQAPYTAVEEQTLAVSAASTLKLHLRRAGGVAIRFERSGK